jgi:hypothetical protein
VRLAPDDERRDEERRGASGDGEAERDGLDRSRRR